MRNENRKGNPLILSLPLRFYILNIPNFNSFVSMIILVV